MFDNKKDYFFVTGLPRTGSTLLTSLLSQNPNIHAAGNSPVSQMMFDMHISVTENCDEQFEALGLNGSEYVSDIINRFYSKTKSKYIFDKSRSWGKTLNVDIIKKYITDKPKFIVLLRSVTEIFSSFINLAQKNEIYDQKSYQSILTGNNEVISESYFATLNLIENHFDDCIFIFYDEIVEDPQKVISKIYNFCNIKPKFKHSFSNIKNKYPENDEAYELLGMHDVRPTISKQYYDVKIQDPMIKIMCENMDSNLLGKLINNQRTSHLINN